MPTAPINAQYEVDMDAVLIDQDIATNTSRVYARLIVRKLSGSGYWTGDQQPWSIDFGGHVVSGGWLYDFTEYTELTLWSDTITHTHNPDGTRTVNYTGTATMDSPPGGTGTVSGSLALPRIPRGPRVKVGAAWRFTVAYVNDNGTWRIALPHVKQGGTWKVAGG